MQIKLIFQKYRLSVIVFFIFMALFLLKDIYGVDFSFIFLSEEKQFAYKSELYLLLGFIISLGFFLNEYLLSEIQEEFQPNIKINSQNESNHNLISESERKLESELEEIKISLKETREELFEKQGNSITEEQKNELVTLIKNKLIESSSKELMDDLINKANQIVKRSTSERLEIHFRKTINRLTAEINALGKRSRVNLIIGSLTAFTGVLIFILFVFERAGDSSAQAYLIKEFAPRISLVIVIEIFAYFFLGLYKVSLSEIKHFHNELTNVEQKHMALEEAIASTDQDTIKEIVKDIAKTERNFLLKKGESTVSLEDRRYTLDEQNGVINALINKISSTK